VAGFGKAQIRKLAQPDVPEREADSATGAPLAPPGYPRFLVFSHDGTTLLGLNGGILTAWDAATLRTLKSTALEPGAAPADPIGKAAVSANGDMVATVGGEISDWYQFRAIMGASKPRVWSILDGSDVPGIIKDPRFTAESVAFSPDGRWLAAARGRYLILWALDAGASSKTLFFNDRFGANRILFSPDSKLVLLDGSVYSVESGTQVTQFRTKMLHKGDESTFGFSPDGQYLLWGDGSLRILGAADWKVKGELFGIAAALSKNGESLAFVQRGGTITIYDFPALTPKMNIPAHLTYPTLLAFGDDGTIVVSAGGDGVLRFWSTSDGSMLKEIRAHTGVISFIRFLPGGRTLLTTSQDGTIRLWGVGP
jgi:WD40 repeat protein